MADTFTTKLGTTRAGERSRVWIEGKRLTAHGFTCGSLFKRQWGEGQLVLSLVKSFTEFDALPVSERGTVSGKGEKPIIDITGVRVTETFSSKGQTHCAVSYRPGRITITATEA